MTFRLIDRLIEDGDDHLRARKVVTRGAFSEERGLFSDYPASLILEGLAQTGGWLIKARRNFLTLAIMSRVEELEALQAVSPGSALDYDASLVAITDDYAVIRAEARRGDSLVLSVGKILYYCRAVTTEELNWGRATYASLLKRQM